MLDGLSPRSSTTSSIRGDLFPPIGAAARPTINAIALEGSERPTAQCRFVRSRRRSIDSIRDVESKWLGSARAGRVASSRPRMIDGRSHRSFQVRQFASRQTQTDPEPGELLTNPGDRPALVLLIRLRPAA